MSILKHRKHYEFYCSLGLDCGMAGMLNETGVRKIAFPFDWLDGSDIKTRASLIENRFKDFFNFNDFEEIILENDSQKDKKRFHNKRTGLNFHHDWLITQTFTQGFESVKDKYNRRCNRLLDLIDKNRGG